MGQRRVTAEELERMGERDHDFELVRGKLVPVTPAGREHGAIAMRLGLRLAAHVERARLGRVYAAETGYVLRRNPDYVRAPDVSFVARDREAAMGGHRGFIQGAPDLAVEVRSPDDPLAGLTAKAADYLAAGASLVWIVDPSTRRVHVHQAGRPVRVLQGSAVLDGGEVLPGISLPLAEVFAGLE